MISPRQILVFGMIFTAASIIGYDSGYLNGVLGSEDFIKLYGVEGNDGDTHLTPHTRSLFSSLIVVGTILGCLINSLLAEKVGHKGILFLASAAYAIGVALQISGLKPAAFIVGRVLLGCGVGFISVTVPTYLIECSNASNRGRFMAIYLQLLTTGNVIACGISLATSNFTDSRGWRITIGFQLFLALIIFAGAIFCPESPTNLLKRNKVDEARQSIGVLRNLDPDSNEVGCIAAEITTKLQKESSFGDTRYAECFQGTNLRRTFLGIAMSFFTVATGITFWFGYGTTFFIAAGVKNSYLISLILAITNWVFTAPSIHLIERVGRRPSLLCGGLIMVITQIMSAITHSVAPDSSTSKNMLIACAVIFIAAYAPTWGIAGWVIMTEPFSDRLRVKQTTIVMTCYWTITWLVGFVTPYMVDATAGNLGVNISYLWAGTSILSVIWAYLYVPELAGLSIDEVDQLFEQTVRAWESKMWQKRLREITGIRSSEVDSEIIKGTTMGYVAEEKDLTQ